MAIPSAIYFDTDCLQDGGEFLNRQAMPQLLILARDLGIQLHVTQLVLDERSPHLIFRWTKDLEAMRRVEKSIGEPIVDNNGCRSDEELIRIMADRFENRLRHAGFTIVPNSAPSLDQLISHAIAKKAPFEPRGKGFCDTIIVESIVAHAVDHYRNRDVLVVTRDAKFAEGLRVRDCREVNITVTNLKEAPELVEKCCDEAWTRLSEQEESTARQFLERNKEQIFAHVELQSVTVRDLERTSSALVHSSVVCVKAIRPVGIGWVQPKQYFSNNCAPGDRIPISFGVVVEFDLLVSNTFPFLGPCSPEIPLNRSGLGDIDVGPPSYQDTCWDSETTVEHSINVSATAVVTQDGQLNDLQILPAEVLYSPDGVIQDCG